MLTVSAQHRSDTRFQFIGTEGFADIVIGPGVQGLNDVVFAIAAGEHDGRGRDFHVFAGPAQELYPGEVRQLPV
ncbi:hypothetical protein D3C71_1856890 [compost metagenome]